MAWRPSTGFSQGSPQSFPPPSRSCTTAGAAGAVCLLTKTLSASTSLTVKFAEDREPFAAGSVYLASPDRHLLVAENCTLSNGSRPLFSPSRGPVVSNRCPESSGPRAIGVVLGGKLHDPQMGYVPSGTGRHGLGTERPRRPEASAFQPAPVGSSSLEPVPGRR